MIEAKAIAATEGSGEHVRYRDYDQAGLDAQYNMRAAVPSYPAFVERWAAASARARASHDARTDIVYGDTADQKLDLFPAARSDGRPAPLHIFIHGGYWQAMDKDHFGYIADGIVPLGAHLAVIDYALAPAVDMDEIVRQVRNAVAWAWRQAADVGADPERLTVSGHSAGGHLTAMALLTDWPAFAPDLPPRPLAGGLAISGLYDLEPIRLCYLNEVIGLTPDSAGRNSPLELLRRRPDEAGPLPPLALCAGGLETPEFHRQQADFAARWAAAGVPPRVVEAPGLNHFSVVDRLADPDGPLARAALRPA